MSANDMTVEALLRAHAPQAPESLRERVFALEPKPRRVSLPSRRLVLVALPAAVAIAVTAAVVHGIVGSGSPSQTVVEQQLAPVAHGAGGSTASPPTWRSATATPQRSQARNGRRSQRGAAPGQRACSTATP